MRVPAPELVRLYIRVIALLILGAIVGAGAMVSMHHRSLNETVTKIAKLESEKKILEENLRNMNMQSDRRLSILNIDVHVRPISDAEKHKLSEITVKRLEELAWRKLKVLVGKRADAFSDPNIHRTLIENTYVISEENKAYKLRLSMITIVQTKLTVWATSEEVFPLPE